MPTRLAALYVCLQGLCAAPPLDAADPETILEVIAEGYLANRTAFTHGKCRYTYSHGTAATEEDALAGKWSDHWPRGTREFVLHFRDDQLSVQAVAEEAQLAEAMRARAPVISPLNVLVNGDYALDHDGQINIARMHSPQAWALNIMYQPFNLALDTGRSDPAKTIQRYLRQREAGWEMQVQEGVELAGRRGVRVEYYAPGNSHRRRWLFDPELGYLPVVTEFHEAESGKFQERMFVDTVEHHQGAVFPTRAVSAAPTVDDRGVAYCEFHEMRVLELDLDYVPTDADLSINIPKNTQFQTGIDSRGSKTLYRGAPTPLVNITTNDVEPIFKQLMGIAEERARQQAAVATVRSPAAPPDTSWLWIPNVVAIVLLAIAFWWRRRRRAAAPRG
jgi:hypothetical protein